MVVFGILARLIARVFTKNTFWTWKHVFALALALTILYACSDEYHQTFVAGRHGSPVDVLIDGAGAWLALGIIP
jgi:VanZ family protein